MCRALNGLARTAEHGLLRPVHVGNVETVQSLFEQAGLQALGVDAHHREHRPVPGSLHQLATLDHQFQGVCETEPAAGVDGAEQPQAVAKHQVGSIYIAVLAHCLEAHRADDEYGRLRESGVGKSAGIFEQLG